ncbi:MFS polyamine transporter [Laccaria bicolor S238N-H82]|uniref:MFS polyamine transporter n=1 Tax=Laccaria bicolor (strain S238N-H82 / ATCC MYA-4686) TaxID=486041 RepID=B0DIL7_LACBS|nr:MFS polyamine transporter [Laccaria bicolor S238N-H82]EDR05708.1 MFS polyamine transporter [Laccaria bicolor S238N-H82]|eukprot:XP_001883812.1 MFS polyamine transporter [Laccaria bicolor S238N-H82]
MDSTTHTEQSIEREASAVDADKEGVEIKSLVNVHEHQLDPRISVTSFHIRRNSEALNSGGEKGLEEPLYIEFKEGDKRNPINFLRKKKWGITALACFSTVISAGTAGAYNLGFASMTRDLNCTDFQATIGLSVYALGFGVTPLVTASFSEELGRLPLYYGSGIGFLLMYMMIALSKNIQTVIIARFLQGAFGSTGSTMVGGTVADIWSSKERGLPMAIFSAAAVGGTGLGPVFAGWIEMNPRLGWKWIQWIQMIICGFYLLLLPLFMRETRSAVLLTRIARKLRKETGDPRYRARVEDERTSLRTLIYISCTRPIYLMLTEMIVSSFSLWIGFAWGITYCLLESVGLTFTNLHGFNTGEVGTVFTAMIIGTGLGFLTNLYQERLYHKNVLTRGPEARLYGACFAAILLPTAMFIYAWSSFTFVHWSVQAIGIVLFTWSAYTIYNTVFTYLADCYGPFASSALAGQSLARNIVGMAFPLFTKQMYKALDFKWANTLFGCLGTAMVPIPFILFFYGPAIRRRSRFSRMVMEAADVSC